MFINKGLRLTNVITYPPKKRTSCIYPSTLRHNFYIYEFYFLRIGTPTATHRITDTLISETTANKVRERSIKGNTIEREMTDTLFFFSCHCERFSVKQSANQGFPVVIQHLQIASSLAPSGLRSSQ
jgi:hypothetical protein